MELLREGFRFRANTVEGNARSRTAQAGTDAIEYLYVTWWALDRISLPDSELKAIRRVRAQGWVPALLSFCTPPHLWPQSSPWCGRLILTRSEEF